MRFQLWIVGGLCWVSGAFGVRAEAVVPAPAAPPPSAAISDGEFALIRTEHGRRFWVSKEHRSGSAKPKSIAHIDDGVAFGRLPVRALPAALKSLAGAKVLVHPASISDATCEVELKDWGLLAEFDTDPEREGDDETPKSPAQRLAAQFADESGAELRYAVDITAATKACKNVVWARLASLPPAQVFAVSHLDKPALNKERVRVRKTAPFREAQSRYAQEGKGLWDKHPDTEVDGWTAGVGSTRFTLTSMRHIDDCQSFNEDATYVFRDQQLLETELSSAFYPKLALDLNGDGMPEWLTENQLIGWNGHSLETLLSVEPASYGCRC